MDERITKRRWTLAQSPPGCAHGCQLLTDSRPPPAAPSSLQCSLSAGAFSRISVSRLFSDTRHLVMLHMQLQIASGWAVSSYYLKYPFHKVSLGTNAAPSCPSQEAYTLMPSVQVSTICTIATELNKTLKFLFIYLRGRETE